jgi:hypothetical protein
VKTARAGQDFGKGSKLPEFAQPGTALSISSSVELPEGGCFGPMNAGK